jgi:hypothetical protein
MEADEVKMLMGAAAVTIRRRVRGVNRTVALALALVWLSAGIAGLVVGYTHGEVLVTMLALFAVLYAVLWFRVVARSRLLTWRDLIAPWRSE